MKTLFIYMLYTLLIYMALIALPQSFVYASVFVLAAMLLALYEWVDREVKVCSG